MNWTSSKVSQSRKESVQQQNLCSRQRAILCATMLETVEMEVKLRSKIVHVGTKMVAKVTSNAVYVCPLNVIKQGAWHDISTNTAYLKPGCSVIHSAPASSSLLLTTCISRQHTFSRMLPICRQPPH
jgi:hypothetical protein